jgi:hypothetical protein
MLPVFATSTAISNSLEYDNHSGTLVHAEALKLLLDRAASSSSSEVLPHRRDRVL